MTRGEYERIKRNIVRERDERLWALEIVWSLARDAEDTVATRDARGVAGEMAALSPVPLPPVL